MDVLKLTPVDISGATTTPIVLEFAECREINYTQQTNPVVFTTANGFAKTFQKPQGREIAFEIVLANPSTLKKIDDLVNAIEVGYLFNCQILQGMLSYNQSRDEAQYSASRGVISVGHVVEWSANWQTAIGAGQRLYEAVRVRIKEGAKESEPQAGDYISAPPLPGGN